MNDCLSNCRKACLVLMVAGPALAVAQEERRQYGPWVWSVAGGAVNQFAADFSDGPGDVSISRGFLQGGLGYAWDRNTSASVSLGIGSTDYDFSSDALIEGREPWERIEDYRLSVPMRFAPTDKMRAIVIPSVRSYAESGASTSDGRTEGVLGGFSWKFSDTLSLGPGMGWFSDVGDDANVFPIILVDWQITDTISLNTGRGLAASQGPGLVLSWKANSKWSLGLTARYEKTRFALEEREGRTAQVGEDASTPLLMTATYTPWPMTSISALAGVEVGGSMALEDGNGREIADSDIDTAAVVGFSFQSRF
ncbi:hypothetical protein EYC87_07855 [Halieaceae bacterium IMCC8485]|uniref:Outer membrane protein beta-barrel domain-containing protein n=1 Tax=Candidatus Seongchinamella marina TaxID=2518990 RepID=A0ABT3SU34_9GAMM|nr:hypothetical protein [Candidatus Seongchinamella marina]